MVLIIFSLISLNLFTHKGISNISSSTHKKFSCRCQPDQSCWPKEADWDDLEEQLNGQLVRPTSIIEVCKKNPYGYACKDDLEDLHNPYFIQDDPAGGQSQGWYNAWDLAVSTYAVEAETVEDIVAAVNFVRKHELRLVVKGAGHDYLGRSCAPNSLLIWTHKMRNMQYHDSFICQGCKGSIRSVSAITVEAGTRWIDAYEEVTTKHHRYVQGGGCCTVGVAGGFTQGGGFGSWSKKYGTGAAGVLEVEVVTADGKVLIANYFQNQDLFWAIRGGGGTFGIVTKMTLQTHPLPRYFGLLQGTITAVDNEYYRLLIEQFLSFFRRYLNNDHWGEQFSFGPDNTIKLSLVTQGLSADDVNNIWKPMTEWLQKYPQFTIETNYLSIPPTKVWDYRFWKEHRPEMIVMNTMPGAPKGEFWWAANSDEVFKYWYTYQSWWLHRELFDIGNVRKLTRIIYSASRISRVQIHINKGLGGGSTDAVRRTNETSTNPSVLDAAALVIMGAGSNDVYLVSKVVSQIKKKQKRLFKTLQRLWTTFEKLCPMQVPM